MAENAELVDDAAGGLRAVFGRLGEFFDIFDLFFLVAGATTLGALSVLYNRLSLQIPDRWPG